MPRTISEIETFAPSAGWVMRMDDAVVVAFVVVVVPPVWLIPIGVSVEGGAGTADSRRPHVLFRSETANGERHTGARLIADDRPSDPCSAGIRTRSLLHP